MSSLLLKNVHAVDIGTDKALRDFDPHMESYVKLVKVFSVIVIRKLIAAV